MAKGKDILAAYEVNLKAILATAANAKTSDDWKSINTQIATLDAGLNSDLKTADWSK